MYKKQLLQKVLVILIMACLPVTSLFCQVRKDTVIQWRTVHEIIELRKTAPRPVMVIFYHPDHDSSMLMLDNVLTKRELIKYLNPRFYSVKINVSDTSVMWFDERVYRKEDTSNYNSIVTNVLGDEVKFPSLLLLNKESTGLVFKGYRSRHEMRSVLSYIAEEVDKTTPYHTWYQAYKVAYPLINLAQNPETPIEWLSLQKALELQKKEPKILFITWYSRLNIGSQVMVFNAFAHPRIRDYMKKHFYCVRLDAQTDDTLYFGKQYINQMKDDRYHDLALLQLENNMKFPSHVFYDRNRKVIFRQQSYLSTINFYALANYIGSGTYKTKGLKDFIKTFKPDL